MDRSVEGYELACSSEIRPSGVGVKVFVRIPGEPWDDDAARRFGGYGGELLEVAQTLIAERDPDGPGIRRGFREEFCLWFREAGLDPVFVEEIPNEYCPRPCCMHRPWFVVTSRIGHIKIGWRKRVVHLEWTRSMATESASVLFPAENVTKLDHTIHAWSGEKVVEYLGVLKADAERQKEG
jgi:hypothetical protein